jgi:hypothetical protein
MMQRGTHLAQWCYWVDLHEVWFTLDDDARATEDEILDCVRPYEPHIRFHGWTECFQADQEQLKLLIDYMTDVCKERNSAAAKPHA